MKTIYLLLFLAFATTSFGQKCKCSAKPMLNEIISCEKIQFDNKASLYWSFNCDSSWLTFSSPLKKNIILYSLEDALEELTGRLGYNYIAEFKNTFLIENRLISGCCQPPEYLLFDKNTGKTKHELGSLLYYSEDKNMPFTIGISDSNYNAIEVYNIDKDQSYYIPLLKNEMKRLMKKEDEMYPETLFQEPDINGFVIKLKYRINGKNAAATKTITINLADKKYW